MAESTNHETHGSGRQKLRTAIIGGGHGCKAVLELVVEGRMSTFNLEILCVVDPNPQSPGILFARELGIFTAKDMKKILDFKALDLIIELTGNDEILAEIYQFIPSGPTILDHTVARVFWDLNEADQNLRKQLQEKIELEEQLKRDRKQLQDIINSLGDAIIVMDQDFIIEAVNAEFIKNTGLASDQVIGRECCDVLREKFGSVWGQDSQCLVKEVIKTGKPRREIREGRGNKGEEIYYEVSATPVFDETGDICRFVETYHRITEQVLLKRETQESIQRFQQFINSAHDLIIMKDIEGRYIVINPSAAALFNRVPEDFIGKADKDLFDQYIVNMFAKKDKEIIEHGTHICYEETLNLYGKKYHLNTVRFPLLDYKGECAGVCVISRDISEQKRLQDNLFQSAKLAALGKLAAGVAHEINNPLSGILAYIEDLLVDTDPHDPVKKEYEVIRREALRCRQIVRDLLDYARLQKPVRQLEDLNRIINRVFSILSKQAAYSHIAFELDLAFGLKAASIDPGQIHQVILNLLMNAAEAMDGKGTIRVTSLYDEKREEAVLSVSDHGNGISPENLKKIFEPFFSTKGAKGNGLGLTVVQSIVEQHGGRVEIDSEVGKGTTFRIFLPASDESTMQS